MTVVIVSISVHLRLSQEKNLMDIYIKTLKKLS